MPHDKLVYWLARSDWPTVGYRSRSQPSCLRWSFKSGHSLIYRVVHKK